MSIEEEFELDNLLFVDRRCRICGQEKNLRNDFYKTRKDRGSNPSAYAYECKTCTIWRVKRKRKRKKPYGDYPDWSVSYTHLTLPTNREV